MQNILTTDAYKYSDMIIAFKKDNLGNKMLDIKQAELPSNKKFGLYFSIFFVMVGIYYLKESNFNLAIILLLTSAFFLLIALFKSQVFLPLNIVWMRLGVLLGIIASPIILGVIFFGLFTPIALVMKLFARDELQLKNSKCESFWKLKDQDPQSLVKFKYQF